VGSRIHIRAATLADARALAPLLRVADAREADAELGLPAEQILSICVDVSWGAWTLELGGELAALFGLIEGEPVALGAKRAQAWLLTSAAVERHPRAFWTACVATLPLLLEDWDVLTADIDARYVQAVRWAKRLGMVVEEARPHGPLGLLFHPVHVRREDL
jgi:hypothetical protein